MPDTCPTDSVELRHQGVGDTAAIQVVIRRLDVSAFVDLNPDRTLWDDITVSLYTCPHVLFFDWPYWKRARLRSGFACLAVAVFTGGVGYA